MTHFRLRLQPMYICMYSMCISKATCVIDTQQLRTIDNAFIEQQKYGQATIIFFLLCFLALSAMQRIGLLTNTSYVTFVALHLGSASLYKGRVRLNYYMAYLPQFKMLNPTHINTCAMRFQALLDYGYNAYTCIHTYTFSGASSKA